MIELQNAPPESKKRFDCSTCKDDVRKKRRCQEQREDFTYKDDKTTFPIQVTKGTPGYSFCPGKATWGHFHQNLYSNLIIATHTGTQWGEGALADQPQWWIELLSWFIPVYDDNKFYSRAKNLMGEANSGKSTPDAVGQGIARNKPAR